MSFAAAVPIAVVVVIAGVVALVVVAALVVVVVAAGLELLPQAEADSSRAAPARPTRVARRIEVS